jgi:hypothetical protein
VHGRARLGMASPLRGYTELLVQSMQYIALGGGPSFERRVYRSILGISFYITGWFTLGMGWSGS